MPQVSNCAFGSFFSRCVGSNDSQPDKDKSPKQSAKTAVYVLTLGHIGAAIPSSVRTHVLTKSLSLTEIGKTKDINLKVCVAMTTEKLLAKAKQMESSEGAYIMSDEQRAALVQLMIRYLTPKPADPKAKAKKKQEPSEAEVEAEGVLRWVGLAALSHNLCMVKSLVSKYCEDSIGILLQYMQLPWPGSHPEGVASAPQTDPAEGITQGVCDYLAAITASNPKVVLASRVFHDRVQAASRSAGNGSEMWLFIV